MTAKFSRRTRKIRHQTKSNQNKLSPFTFEHLFRSGFPCRARAHSQAEHPKQNIAALPSAARRRKRLLRKTLLVPRPVGDLDPLFHHPQFPGGFTQLKNCDKARPSGKADGRSFDTVVPEYLLIWRSTLRRVSTSRCLSMSADPPLSALRVQSLVMIHYRRLLSISYTALEYRCLSPGGRQHTYSREQR